MINLNGILLINKPKGYTSRDVVNKVSSILGTKKIGHTGTLDPLATGVLVLTIGKCTKLSSMLTSEYKEYDAKFILGYETDTLDITGAKTKESNLSVDKDLIINTINSFLGTYIQEVPKYSAVKVDGKKLYEYARNNIEVTLPKKTVDIKEIEILDIDEKFIEIRTTVSKGTYIRSLIRDIGEALGTYATMTDLIRTKQGNFSLDECNTLQDIENSNYRILNPIEFLQDIKSISVDSELLKKIDNGVRVYLDDADRYIKFVNNAEVLAIYEKEQDYYKMYVKLI